MIIAGTPLVISPANSLVYGINDELIRVIINRISAGQDLGQGRESRDMFVPEAAIWSFVSSWIIWGDSRTRTRVCCPKLVDRRWKAIGLGLI